MEREGRTLTLALRQREQAETGRLTRNNGAVVDDVSAIFERVNVGRVVDGNGAVWWWWWWRRCGRCLSHLHLIQWVERE